jgi:hypothetical protein
LKHWNVTKDLCRHITQSFFLQYKDLNSGPTPWAISPALFLWMYFSRSGLADSSSWLASNYDPLYLCLLGRLDYRNEPWHQVIFVISVFSSVFVFGGTGAWTQVFTLAKQVRSHMSDTSSRFWSDYILAQNCKLLELFISLLIS